MRELELHEIEMVSGGDAAATRIAGTDSWGDIVNERLWLGAQCQAAGGWGLYCFDFAMKYGNAF